MKNEIINFWLEDKDDKKYSMTFEEFFNKFVNSDYYKNNSNTMGMCLESLIFFYITKKECLNSNYEKAKIFQLVDYVATELLND